jgi:multidrug efflux pump subunit AcrB
VPLRELGRFERVPGGPIIYRKDLRAVEYVVAMSAAPGRARLRHAAGREDAQETRLPGAGRHRSRQAYWLGPPPDDQVSGFEWAGEWTVTYETFRDMGLAFGVALVLIYILVVWEFGNFRIPLVIMAPIPLTLLGIIPAHWLMFQLGSAASSRPRR